jgi:CspA family cold shock protein
VVSRFEHGWGFIECEAMNRNFFVHYSDVEGTGMRSLEAGEAVSFDLAPGKDGRPKAVRVRRQVSGRASPRASRPQGFPRSDTGLPTPSGGSSSDEAPAPAGAPMPHGGPAPHGGYGLPVDEPEDSETPLDETLPASESRPGRT